MAIGDTPLKLTRDAKATVQLAFEDLGGISRLVEWANQPANLGTFYTQIWSKIIPKDVKADVDGQIVIEIAKFGESPALTSRRNLSIEPEEAVIVGQVIAEACDDED